MIVKCQMEEEYIEGKDLIEDGRPRALDMLLKTSSIGDLKLC